MRYQHIDSDLFVQNRKKFSQSIDDQSIAIFNANDIMPTNADGVMPFRQNNDLFYLTGVDQEETVLVLCPRAKKEGDREVLFVKETNEHIAVWEGEKLTKEKATEVSGIQSVLWLSQLEGFLARVMPSVEKVYLNTNEHARSTSEVETRDARFAKQLKASYPLHQYKRSAPLVGRLRSIKSATEIELMQRACDITEAGFRQVLSALKPGMMEYEVEAIFAYEFLRKGSRGFAYQPIVASGKSACVLHYISNHQPCQDGDLLLLDVGAEYANYASDMSRTIPVSGRFSQRQRDVYNAVLRVMRQAIQALVIGGQKAEYEKMVGELMTEELTNLGLLKPDAGKGAFRKYYMHGTSHYLGLDVHDVGEADARFESGMVFTCEPGIYIPEEGIGVRLENDILVTEEGPVDLMENIPIEIEEIETLMQEKQASVGTQG